MAYCEKKTAEPVIPAAAYVLTLTEDEARRVLAACRSRIAIWRLSRQRSQR